MTAINKYRIVGPRYKQQTRIYQDETFYFSSDEGPQNVIITAKNTFGKGVLLQLLFQPMIPKTTWNRGKNTVNHFFYAARGQFKPYTFFSCIDFHLDLGRHLLVGVAMTSQLNEKNDSEPLYTLFVREYGFSLYDLFTIDNIPLYNKEKGAPISYADFLEYLRKNKKEFLTFNENSKSKFYKTMESYGIIKKDWEQLIDINQYEGGVAHYFDDKDATTNNGLFSKMIIPAIEARMTEKGEENNLITLFKNIASITRNLPELKKNATAYAEIKNHNQEVNLRLGELIQEKDIFDIHIEKGRSILTALTNEKSILEKEINDHKEQSVELENQKLELMWKQQNLQYVIKYYELSKIMSTIQSFEEKQVIEKEREAILKAEKIHAELLLQLKKWHEKEKNYQETRKKIEAIEHSQEYRDSKSLQIELEVEIENEWNHFLTVIKRISAESEAYKKYVDEQNKLINREMKVLEDQLLDHKVDKGMIDKSIEEFDKDIMVKKQQYGEYFYYDMGKIHTQKSNELKSAEESSSRLLTDQEDKLGAKADLEKRYATIITEIESLEKDGNKMKEQWERQQKKEEVIMEKVWKILRVNPVEVDDFRKWSDDQIMTLKNRKKDWDIKLNQLNLQLYEVAFEVTQHDNPYLIPSEEVYKAKSLLTEKGVPVIYGDEYIKQQESAKREELNRKHPLLKYGLIVPNQNKRYLDEVKKVDKAFFHAPIPIFWVNELDQTYEIPFTILDKEATELSISDDKLLAYKQALSSKSDQTKSQIDNTKEYIEQLTTIAVELESFDDVILSVELAKQYQTHQQQLIQKKEDKVDMEKQAGIMKKELEVIADAIASVSTNIESLTVEIENLKEWIKNKETYESEKQEHYKLSLKIQSMNQKIGNKKNELTVLKDDFEIWKGSLFEWRKWKDNLVEKVRQVLPKIHVEDEKTEVSQATPPTFETEADKLMEWLYKWEAAQQEMNSHNTELVKLRTDLNHYQRGVVDEEKELSQLNIEWKKYQVPQESISILKKEVDNKNKSLNEINNTLLELKLNIRHAKTQKDNLEDELSEMKSTILRDFEKHPEIWVPNDFPKMKIEIQQAIAENAKDLKDTVVIIKELENKISNFKSALQNLEITLKTLNISSGNMPSSYIQELVKKSPMQTGDEWIEAYVTKQQNKDRKKSALQSIHREKKEVFEQSGWRATIKEVAQKVYSDMNFDELDEARASIEGLDLLATNEIMEAEEEKNTAEEAKKEWVEHACKYALQIVEHLRKMIKSMRIINRNGLTFPLVKLKKDNLLPKEIEQIKGNIDGLFDKIITEIFAEYQEINDIPQKVFKERISTKNIIFTAFNYQYPVLRLYRLHEENSFLYEPPKEEFYTEWETINESSKTDPSGSGGQLFSARTLIMMMLVSFKRTNEENTNWKLLITDNPFSVAVSDHIVDPILAIAEELKFQWIVVTPPELVKVELLQKFDIYYQLSAKPIATGTDQVVSEVQYGYRKYKKSKSILREEKISFSANQDSL